MMRKPIAKALGIAMTLWLPLCLFGAEAQQTASESQTMSDPILIEPLFEYPTPPEEIENLQDRSDYLMQHFWDQMDFKKKEAVDQNALNHAFDVYISAMRFSSEPALEASVKTLLEKISKNPALSIQFAKAAEESLYGNRASVWNDSLFIRFIDNLLQNKQVKQERKLRYQMVRNKLANTLQGQIPPEFDYMTPDGRTAHYSPNGVITVIEFGDPDCDDCRFAKLRLDTNVRFSSLVEKGKVNVLFINVDPEDGWEEKLKGYPSAWHVGASNEISDIYDIRDYPDIYVIDREGRVAVKHVDVETAMSIAAAASEQTTPQ